MRAERSYGEDEEVRLPLPANVQEEVWTTRDGVAIPVGEMTLSHCRNALRLVVRTARARRAAAAEKAKREAAPAALELGPNGQPW